MQDAGWKTTITAEEVYTEINPYLSKRDPLSTAELRIVLMLYCQLAEAGGVYEAIKNIMAVVTLKPYLLWPFKDLVRVRAEPRRVIAPNANATFRDLATAAKQIGLLHLSRLLESAFRDDIRNGISHADYVIWSDGVRLRNRNGGDAKRVSFDEVAAALLRGVGFFEILQIFVERSVQSFNPPKTIVARFSANPPMPQTVSYDPATGAFGISCSSPGPVITPEYQRQFDINSRLGGKVVATFWAKDIPFRQMIDAYILSKGFEANDVVLSFHQLGALVADVDKLGLWDDRHPHANQGAVLLATPWGFRWIYSLTDFDSALPEPIVKWA